MTKATGGVLAVEVAQRPDGDAPSAVLAMVQAMPVQVGGLGAVARLSIARQHISVPGRYSVQIPGLSGGMSPLHDPGHC
ncbi:hypothetical protein [Streptomyces sp. NPDC056387]|uniref:hypothetical protein n=1 Tax=Streptomyces sp. NPDC056387 TaxID=3345803 RepID=UPI0035DC5AB1